MASLFMLDTAGDQQLLSGQAQHSSALYGGASKDRRRLLLEEHAGDEVSASEDEQEDVEFFGLTLQSKDFSKIVATSQAVTKKAPSKVALQLDAITEQVSEAVQNAGTHTLQKRKKRVTDLDTSEFNTPTGRPDEDLTLRKANVELDMKTAKHVPCFEQLKAMPKPSSARDRKFNKAERERTKGKGWFDLPATEVTDEMRNELKIIQMRSVLDPKHFYKKNDLKVLPKYFQIGTVQHSPLDYYNERHTRKTKKSLVDELMEDEAFQKFNKRKYKEVVERNDKYAHRKAVKKMKKLKKHK